MQQTKNGLPIANMAANVAVDNAGSIFTAAHLDTTPKFKNGLLPTEPKLSQVDAVVSVAGALGYNTLQLKNKLSYSNGVVKGASFALSDIPIQLNYFVTPKNDLQLVYKLSIKESKRWYYIHMIIY